MGTSRIEEQIKALSAPSDDPFPGICVSNALKSRVYSCTEPVCLRRSSRSRTSLKINPQTDGQTERANQALEQMLRAFVDSDQRNWDQCLHMAEF